MKRNKFIEKVDERKMKGEREREREEREEREGERETKKAGKKDRCRRRQSSREPDIL